MNKNLEDRIDCMENDLAKMREELQKSKDFWTEKDIVSGMVAGVGSLYKILVLETGYCTHRYYMSGLSKNPFEAFSNCNKISAKEMAEYFNSGNYKKLGILKTEFQK